MARGGQRVRIEGAQRRSWPPQVATAVVVVASALALATGGVEHRRALSGPMGQPDPEPTFGSRGWSRSETSSWGTMTSASTPHTRGEAARGVLERARHRRAERRDRVADEERHRGSRALSRGVTAYRTSSTSPSAKAAP